MMMTPGWCARRKAHFRLSPYLVAVALTPALLQTSTSLSCGGDTSLSELEVFVEGEGQILGFDPDRRRYGVLLPVGTNEARVRSVSADAGARVWMDIFVDGEQFASDGYGSSQGYGVGGQDDVVPVPAEPSVLRVWVSPPGGPTGFYDINLRPVGLPFPCSEQGIRDAIAFGGGPHTFGCDGPTVVPTEAEIVIDNDVILDGEGKMIVDAGGNGGDAGGAELAAIGVDAHRVFSIPEGVTAELIRLTVTGGMTTEEGGGVLSEGTLILTNSVVSRNMARFGGGIRNQGEGQAYVIDTLISNNIATQAAGGISNRLEQATMTLDGCTVEGNYAAGNIGGIANTGTLSVNETTVLNNEAAGEAGGIRNSQGRTMVVTNSTVSGNSATSDGGGIVNRGMLSLTDATVSGNEASGAAGGIYNMGMLTLSSSTLSLNTAASQGGGIWNEDGTLIVTGSTIAGNTASTSGGGIENYSGSIEIYSSTISGNTTMAGGGGGIENPFPDGTLSLINTTVSGNSSVGRGAIENAGTATVIASTLSLNVADGTVLWDGACLLDPSCPPGTLTLRNTILDGSCIGTPAVDSLGGNIESPGNTCGLSPTAGTDQINVPAATLNLGPLANNGGATATHELLPGSIAIDWVPVGACVDAEGLPLLADQRGFSRPQGPACDSGSFEREDGTQPLGACINDVDRAAYEMLEYIDDQGMLSTCIDAAAVIGADCVFGSPQSEPPLAGCGAEAAAVIACFPTNCPEEVIDALGTCVASCTAGATGLSSSCADCYGEAMACSTAFCVQYCVADINSPPCIACRIDNGCIPGFDACTGLPGDIDCAVTVGGTVVSDPSGAPVEGATVSVLGASISTVTDAAGRFSLESPAGNVFFQISKESTWGTIELEVVPTTGDLQFEVIEDSFVAAVEQFLAIEIDETQGVVDVLFNSPSGLGGETATLFVPYDSSLTFDADEQPVLSDRLVPGGSEDLVFVGVDLTEDLTVSPTGVDGVNSCDLQNPGRVYPVLAKSFTRVRQVQCTPFP